MGNNVQPSSELKLGTVKCVEVRVEEWIDLPRSITAGADSEIEEESDVSGSDKGWVSDGDSDEPGAVRQESMTLMGDVSATTPRLGPADPPLVLDPALDSSHPRLPSDPADGFAEGMHAEDGSAIGNAPGSSAVAFSDASLLDAELEAEPGAAAPPSIPAASSSSSSAAASSSSSALPVSAAHSKIIPHQSGPTRLFRISEIMFEVQNDFELDLSENGIGGLTGEGESLDFQGVPVKSQRSPEPSEVINVTGGNSNNHLKTHDDGSKNDDSKVSQSSLSLDYGMVSDTVSKAVKTQGGRYELWKPDSRSQSRKEAIKIKTIRDRRTGEVKGLKPVHWYYYDVLSVPSHLPFPMESSKSKSLVDFCSFQRAEDGRVFHWRSMWYGNVRNGDLIRYSNCLSKRLNRGTPSKKTVVSGMKDPCSSSIASTSVSSAVSSAVGVTLEPGASEVSVPTKTGRRSTVDSWGEYFKFKDQFVTEEQLRQKPRNAALYHDSHCRQSVKSGEMEPSMMCTDHRMSLTEFLEHNDQQHVMELQFTLGRYVRMKTHKVHWGRVYVTIPDSMVERAIEEAVPVLAPMVLEDERERDAVRKKTQKRKECRERRKEKRRQRREHRRQRRRVKNKAAKSNHHKKYISSEESSVVIKDVGFAVVGGVQGNADIIGGSGFETPKGGESSASPIIQSAEQPSSVPMSNDNGNVDNDDDGLKSSSVSAAIAAGKSDCRRRRGQRYDLMMDEDWEEKQMFACSPHVLPPPLRNIDPAMAAFEIRNGISEALSHARKSTAESLKSAVSSAALSLSESMLISQSSGTGFRKSAMSLDVISQSRSAPPMGGIDEEEEKKHSIVEEFVKCPLCLTSHIHRTDFKRHINEDCTET